MIDFEWKKTFPTKLLEIDQVHVWRASLIQTEGEKKACWSTLSNDERQRADRFHFEKDHFSFVAARGILRQILGYYLDQVPEKIIFGYTSFGKPYLLNRENEYQINFNISHSGNLGLFAFSLNKEVGVDIELVKENISTAEIVERFFTKNEKMDLQKALADEKIKLFYQFWTRKEAVLKAIGSGVSFPLEKCEVSGGDGIEFTPVNLQEKEGYRTRWYFKDLFVGNNFFASLALGTNCNKILFLEL
jgi:4'-phosphopantetheinyl transferase